MNRLTGQPPTGAEPNQLNNNGPPQGMNNPLPMQGEQNVQNIPPSSSPQNLNSPSPVQGQPNGQNIPQSIPSIPPQGLNNPSAMQGQQNGQNIPPSSLPQGLNYNQQPMENDIQQQWNPPQNQGFQNPYKQPMVQPQISMAPTQPQQQFPNYPLYPSYNNPTTQPLLLNNPSNYGKPQLTNYPNIYQNPNNIEYPAGGNNFPIQGSELNYPTQPTNTEPSLNSGTINNSH